MRRWLVHAYQHAADGVWHVAYWRLVPGVAVSRRNPPRGDERLRELERAVVAQGTPDAYAALNAELLRRGLPPVAERTPPDPGNGFFYALDQYHFTNGARVEAMHWTDAQGHMPFVSDQGHEVTVVTYMTSDHGRRTRIVPSAEVLAGHSIPGAHAALTGEADDGTWVWLSAPAADALQAVLQRVASMPPDEPRRRNPDERLRDLERRAQQGDLEAQAALEAARVRTTDPVDVLDAEVDERVARALGPGASLNEWARLKRDLARAVGWCLDAAPYERGRTSQVPELGDVTADVQGVTFSWFAKHAWTGETVAPRAVAEAWIDRMAITRRPGWRRKNPDERLRGLERRAAQGDHDAQRALEAAQARVETPEAKTARAMQTWADGGVVPPDHAYTIPYQHAADGVWHVAYWRLVPEVRAEWYVQQGAPGTPNEVPWADVFVNLSSRSSRTGAGEGGQDSVLVLGHELITTNGVARVTLDPEVQRTVWSVMGHARGYPRQNPGDEGWRAAERAWSASPGDAALEAAYLAAWERVGSPGRSPLRDPAPGDVVDCETSKGGTVYRFEVASVAGGRMVRRFLGEVVNGTLVWPKHGSRGHTPKVAVSSRRRAARRVVRRMADHPIQHNPDDAYRAAERGAQYGDPQAQAAALTARLRAGDLDPRVVQLAAQLGHPAAGLLMPPDNVWRGPGPIELAREFMGDEKLVLWLADCAERAPFPTSRGVGARAADEVLRLAREWAQGGGKFCGLTDRMQHAQRALSNQAARRTAVPGAVHAARARNTVLDYIGNLGDKGGPLPAFQALATLNEALEAAGMVAYHRAIMEAPLGTAYVHVGQARSAEERWQNLRLAQYLLGEAP